MSEDRKKRGQSEKDAQEVRVAEDCEPNTGEPGTGPWKPACPDGYPDEQEGKPAKEK